MEFLQLLASSYKTEIEEIKAKYEKRQKRIDLRNRINEQTRRIKEMKQQRPITDPITLALLRHDVEGALEVQKKQTKAAQEIPSDDLIHVLYSSPSMVEAAITIYPNAPQVRLMAIKYDIPLLDIKKEDLSVIRALQATKLAGLALQRGVAKHDREVYPLWSIILRDSRGFVPKKEDLPHLISFNMDEIIERGVTHGRYTRGDVEKCRKIMPILGPNPEVAYAKAHFETFITTVVEKHNLADRKVLTFTPDSKFAIEYHPETSAAKVTTLTRAQNGELAKCEAIPLPTDPLDLAMYDMTGVMMVLMIKRGGLKPKQRHMRWMLEHGLQRMLR